MCCVGIGISTETFEKIEQDIATLNRVSRKNVR